MMYWCIRAIVRLQLLIIRGTLPSELRYHQIWQFCVH